MPTLTTAHTWPEGWLQDPNVIMVDEIRGGKPRRSSARPLLLDLDMPEVDGDEAILRLRKDFALKAFAPDVVLSRVNAVLRRIQLRGDLMKAQMTSIPYRLTTLVAALVIAGLPADGAAQAMPTDLGQATLEELLGLEVTSAGRRQQRAEDVAAAIYVITQDDIRRSGLTVLPEILRLAPGVQVGRISSNRWAVSVRGFNGLYSNKLLVLVDGRSVYNRSFSGVYWDGQDLDVAEIERIEIVRGPGGALWGANAVNGVINIITRSAHRSAGGSATVALGTFDSRATLRYSGAVGRTSYRLHGQWSGYGDSVTPGAGLAGDHWHSATGGYRLDWANATDTLMAQGHYTAGRNPPGATILERIAPDVHSLSAATATSDTSALGRWTKTSGAGAVSQVQAYTTYSRRDEGTIHLEERSSDLDVQHEKTLPGHVLVAGAGYRHVSLDTEGTLGVQIAPERSRMFNVFVHDEMALGRRVRLTAGARLEYETFSGWDVAPSVRGMWEATARQRVWAAVSRSRRTSAASYRTLRVNLASVPGRGLPVLLAVTGNPQFESETLAQVDAGYRVRLGSNAALDVSAFRGRYDGLLTTEPQPPVFEATPAPAHLLVALQFANLMTARTSGVEVAVHWSPWDVWRLDASYTGLRITAATDPTSLDTRAETFDGSAPRHQWQARSTTRIGARTRAHVGLYRFGALREFGIPTATRLDANVEVTLRRGLTLVVTGRDLLTPSHEEFSGAAHGLTAWVAPRHARAELRWSF